MNPTEQTTEEKPETTKQPSRYWVSIALVFLVVGVLAGIVLFYQPPTQYKFEAIEQNTLFASNEYAPKNHLALIAEKPTFVVVVPFEFQGQNNSFYASAPVLFTQVLTYKQKKVIIVFQQLDANGTMTSCQTNYGDINRNVTIGLGECNSLLSPSETVGLIQVIPANNALERPIVLLQQNKVLIEPKIGEDVSPVSFLVLKAMYSDSSDIINILNQAIQQIKA